MYRPHGFMAHSKDKQTHNNQLSDTRAPDIGSVCSKVSATNILADIHQSF